MARRTGLEPATPGVTGRYSNQLNYRRISDNANKMMKKRMHLIEKQQRCASFLLKKTQC